MPQRVLKYALPPRREFALELPTGAQILTAQTQGASRPRLWARVTRGRPLERRVFRLVATGEDLADDFDREHRYAATFQTESGLRVYHLFERVAALDAPLDETRVPLS